VSVFLSLQKHKLTVFLSLFLAVLEFELRPLYLFEPHLQLKSLFLIHRKLLNQEVVGSRGEMFLVSVQGDL
jgi:hypothetical protein